MLAGTDLHTDAAVPRSGCGTAPAAETESATAADKGPKRTQRNAESQRKLLFCTDDSDGNHRHAMAKRHFSKTDPEGTQLVSIGIVLVDSGDSFRKQQNQLAAVECS